MNLKRTNWSERDDGFLFGTYEEERYVYVNEWLKYADRYSYTPEFNRSKADFIRDFIRVLEGAEGFINEFPHDIPYFTHNRYHFTQDSEGYVSSYQVTEYEGETVIQGYWDGHIFTISKNKKRACFKHALVLHSS